MEMQNIQAMKNIDWPLGDAWEGTMSFLEQEFYKIGLLLPMS